LNAAEAAATASPTADEADADIALVAPATSKDGSLTTSEVTSVAEI
jgi:hypothetical protein